MSTEMVCDCGVAMQPREGGGWTRPCGCKHGRYWASCPPLASDLRVYMQLTGKSIRFAGVHPRLYRY